MASIRTPFPVHAILLGATVVALAACAPEDPLVLGDGMDPDSVFAAEVVPVLRAQCEGCHFRGGELYATLPFDSPALVLSIQGEILGGLEGAGRDRVEAWVRWMNAAADSGGSVGTPRGR